MPYTSGDFNLHAFFRVGKIIVSVITWLIFLAIMSDASEFTISMITRQILSFQRHSDYVKLYNRLVVPHIETILNELISLRANI